MISPNFWHFILLKERSCGGVWLWSRNGYIKMNSLSSFREHHFRCFHKFVSKFLFILVYVDQHQMSSPHFIKLGNSDTTWMLLKHYKTSKVERNSLPEHAFEILYMITGIYCKFFLVKVSHLDTLSKFDPTIISLYTCCKVCDSQWLYILLQHGLWCSWWARRQQWSLSHC